MPFEDRASLDMSDERKATDDMLLQNPPDCASSEGTFDCHKLPLDGDRWRISFPFAVEILLRLAQTLVLYELYFH